MSDTEVLQCLNDGDGACQGVVELRESLSGTGVPIARCDHHWSVRLELQRDLARRYPRFPPADWSPDDAGESWGDEDD